VTQGCDSSKINQVIDHVAIFLAGLFAWTFVEYLIHAWLSHIFDTFAKPLHEVHHRDPRAVFTIGAWIPIAVIWIAGLAIFGFAAGMIFFTGIVAGFILYEVLHYRIHFSNPSGAVEAYLRSRHLVHHQRNPNACFGVTSEMWDLIFGTELLGSEKSRLCKAVASTPPSVGPTNVHKLIDFFTGR
jgi:sterol desaturase/sphingolipid hydroxylase (fatty acid hydroxylase superfamily)